MTREFTIDEQKEEAKLKAMAAKPKEKSRTPLGLRSGPESWSLSSPVVPSRCSLVKEAAALSVAQTCQSLWHKTQKTSSFSCCSVCSWEVVHVAWCWVHLASPEREHRKENSKICSTCSQLPPSPGCCKNINMISAIWALRLQTMSIGLQPSTHRVFHLMSWAHTQRPASIQHLASQQYKSSAKYKDLSAFFVYMCSLFTFAVMWMSLEWGREVRKKEIEGIVVYYYHLLSHLATDASFPDSSKENQNY